MRCVSRPHRAAAAALAVALMIAGPAPAQEEFKKAEKPSFGTFNKLRDMKAGRVAVVDRANPATTKENRDVLDAVARWFVYRLIDPEYQKETQQGFPGSGPRTLNELLDEAKRDLLFFPADNKPRPDNQLDYVFEFGKVMTTRLREILTNRTVAVRFNAARMLSEVCRTGYDGAGVVCTALLRNDKELCAPGETVVHEAVKVHAVLGLKNLLGVTLNVAKPERTPFTEPTPNENNRKVDEGLIPEIDALTELLKIVTAKHPTRPSDEEQAVIHYTRREAIRALGNARLAVVKDRNLRAVRPGHALLQIALGEGVEPAPTVSERVEALAGFFQLRPDATMNLDYATYHAGVALRQLVTVKLQGSAETATTWKLFGNRMLTALPAWVAQCKRLPESKHPWAVEFDSKVRNEVFGQLEGRGPTSAAGPPDPQPLNAWLAEKQAALGARVLHSDAPNTTLAVPAN